MIPEFSVVESWGNDGNVDVVFLENLPHNFLYSLNNVVEHLVQNKSINNNSFKLEELITKILEYWVSTNKLRYSPVVKKWVYNE